MLRGRETEQTQISALLDEAWASRGGALVLRGPAGIGKSALLADTATRAEGMRVLQVQGIESESDLALAALSRLLRPVSGFVDRLTPPQAAAMRAGFGENPAGGGTNRFLVYSATLSLLAEAAETQPVLCVVDDAQWLDEGTAHALLFTARRLGVERVAMLFAAREDHEEGFEAAGVPALTVAGLDRAAAHALLEESAGGRVHPDVAAHLLAATGGNPLALVELPTALTAGALSGQEPLPASLPVTEGVERAFLARVRRLPANAQTLLLVAAAEGAGDLATIQSASASLDCGPAALEAAEQSGLVHTRGGQLAFRHPLVRSSVYGAATTSARQAAHGALARCLATLGDVERSAWHSAAAAVAPDETIAAQLGQAAARATTRGAPSAASAAFERAAQLTADPETRARRLWFAAEQARLAGHHRRALTLLESARATSLDPSLQADVDLLVGAVELVTGSPGSAEQVLMKAALGIRSRDPGRALQLLVIAAQAAALADHAVAEIEIGRVAAAMPRGTDARLQFFADLLVGCGQYLSGEASSSTTLLREVVRQAQDFDDSMLMTWAGRAAFYLGDDDAAYELDSKAVARARAVGAIGDMLPPLQRLALSEILRGRWSTANANAAEALRFAWETGQQGFSSLPLGWLALLAAYRGDTTELRSHLDAADAVLPRHPMAVASESLALGARSVRSSGRRPRRSNGAPRSCDQSGRFADELPGPDRDRGPDGAHHRGSRLADRPHRLRLAHRCSLGPGSRRPRPRSHGTARRGRGALRGEPATARARSAAVRTGSDRAGLRRVPSSLRAPGRRPRAPAKGPDDVRRPRRSALVRPGAPGATSLRGVHPSAGPECSAQADRPGTSGRRTGLKRAVQP